MIIQDFIARKQRGERISMVTCYDAWSARLIAGTAVDCLLVGDSLAMVVLGIGSAWAVYQKRWIDPDRVARSVPPLYKLSFNKFYIDEIYNFFIVKLVLLMAKVSAIFDLGVIDGIVNWCGKVAKGGGDSLAALQSGNVRDYLFFMSLGAAVVLGVWLWL